MRLVLLLLCSSAAGWGLLQLGAAPCCSTAAGAAVPGCCWDRASIGVPAHRWRCPHATCPALQTIARSIPSIAYFTTLAIRFANNVVRALKPCLPCCCGGRACTACLEGGGHSPAALGLLAPSRACPPLALHAPRSTQSLNSHPHHRWAARTSSIWLAGRACSEAALAALPAEQPPRASVRCCWGSRCAPCALQPPAPTRRRSTHRPTQTPPVFLPRPPLSQPGLPFLSHCVYPPDPLSPPHALSSASASDPASPPCYTLCRQ